METSNIPPYSVIRYIRNKKRVPYGVIVAVKSGEGFNIGYSLCNKKDRFNKRMALNIALGRAELSGNMDFNHPHDIRKNIPAFVERCKKYYKV